MVWDLKYGMGAEVYQRIEYNLIAKNIIERAHRHKMAFENNGLS